MSEYKLDPGQEQVWFRERSLICTALIGVGVVMVLICIMIIPPNGVSTPGDTLIVGLHNLDAEPPKKVRFADVR